MTMDLRGHDVGWEGLAEGGGQGRGWTGWPLAADLRLVAVGVAQGADEDGEANNSICSISWKCVRLPILRQSNNHLVAVYLLFEMS
jgi:hypothetical protein